MQRGALAGGYDKGRVTGALHLGKLDLAFHVERARHLIHGGKHFCGCATAEISPSKRDAEALNAAL